MAEKAFLYKIPPAVREELIGLVAARLLPEYGAIFVAAGRTVPPDRLIFTDERDVERFQQSVEIGTVQFGHVSIELQRPAAEALAAAAAEAESAGLSITPRAADSGRRHYTDTVELWRSRVEPALDHWTGAGKLDSEKAEHIRGLSPFEQVAPVFELERRGLWFAKDLSKSVIYSVAPPGASQHLSMLAFDATEFGDPHVRRILARHFWYQTVVSDLPHFTFLGIPESKLEAAGLKRVTHLDRPFWVPDLDIAG